MSELHPLLVPDGLAGDVCLGPVGVRPGLARLVQAAVRQRLPVHVELEHDVFPACDELAGVGGQSGAEEHQFVIGGNDGISETSLTVNYWSSRVGLPGSVSLGPAVGLVSHEDLEGVESPVFTPVVRGAPSWSFIFLFLYLWLSVVTTATLIILFLNLIISHVIP